MLVSLAPENVMVVEAAGSLSAEQLDPREEACIARALEKRRGEFRAGRACARGALALIGIEGFSLLSGEDRAPLWPRGVVGSITHTRGYCAAAVARWGPVLGIGIDAEAADDLRADLVRMVCTPAELAGITMLPGGNAGRWAKLIFSAKESAYKCYYSLTRTRLGFADMEICVLPGSNQFTATLLREDCPAAGGARTFAGRFAWSQEHVFTMVTLEASSRSTVERNKGGYVRSS